MARRGSDSEQPDESAIPEAEKLPASDPSMYIVTTDVEQQKAARAKKQATGGGAVKPPTLPADEYVVGRPLEQPADDVTTDAAPAPVADVTPVRSAADAATPPEGYVIRHETIEDATPASAPGAAAAPASTTAPVPPLATTPAPTVPLVAMATEPLAPGAATASVDGGASGGPTTAADAPTIVYRDRPVPPKPHGNRAFGVLITVLAAVLYAVLYAFAVLIVFRAITGVATMDLLANPGYWIAPLLFVVVQLASVLVLNRASWWAHIIASAIVAMVVYFGASYLVGLVELYAWRSDLTYAAVLGSPTSIVSGLLAREIALWAGAAIARRGRAVRARNAAERAAFDAAHTENAGRPLSA